MPQQTLPPSRLPTVDWERWSSWTIEPTLVQAMRRDEFIDAAMYVENCEDFMQRIRKITNKVPPQIEPGVDALFVATQQRLWDVLDWLSLQYSAGAPVEQIREVWPYAMRWAEEYAMFHEAHHLDPNNKGGIVPHAALRTEDYWTVALRLLCFGMLTGYSSELPRVMRILDYGNELMGVRDGLIERLVAPFLPERGTPPDTATRHLPYRKLFKVYDAEPDKRAALMSRYLGEWYEASRREPYIDHHLGTGVSHFGYWAWEAAATTWVLGIDDATYRDMPFYPRDLIDLARTLPQPAELGAAAASAAAAGASLRCEGGQPCPQSGWWSTPAQPNSRRRFEAGEVMPVIEGSAWGATIWYRDGEQG